MAEFGAGGARFSDPLLGTHTPPSSASPPFPLSSGWQAACLHFTFVRAECLDVGPGSLAPFLPFWALTGSEFYCRTRASWNLQHHLRYVRQQLRHAQSPLLISGLIRKTPQNGCSLTRRVSPTLLAVGVSRDGSWRGPTSRLSGCCFLLCL